METSINSRSKTFINLVSPRVKDLLIVNFLLEPAESGLNSTPRVNYYSCFEDYSDHQDLQSILLMDIEALEKVVNSGLIENLDFSKTLIYRTDRHGSFHMGIPVYFVHGDFELMRERFRQLLNDKPNKSPQNPKEQYLIVRLGETFHWINTREIDRVEQREGLTFIVHHDGTEYPSPGKFNLIGKRMPHYDHRKDAAELTTSYPHSLNEKVNNRNGLQLGALFKWILVLGFTLMLSCTLIAQPTQELAKAVTLSHQGDYMAAEVLFDRLTLEAEEQSPPFILARAYNFSWSGQYDMAATLFRSLLDHADFQEEALVGLAYNSSWSGQHALAVQLFNQIMHDYPDNRSGYFGQALNYLSVENPQGAQYIANQILKLYPEDPESHYIQGIIHLKELQPQLARRAFKRSLELNPEFEASKRQLDEIGLKASHFAIGVWYGLSDASMETRHGFRRADLRYQIDPLHTIYAYYDNSLILDNSFIAQDKIASLFAIGYKHGWSEKLFSRLEFGNRIFRDEKDQYLVQLENVYFFSSRWVGQINFQYDFRGSQQFGTVAAGLNLGLSRHLRIEGNYFHTRDMDNEDIHNQRLVFGPKLLTKSIELSGGIFYDWLNLEELKSQQWSGYFLLGRLQLTRYLEGQFLIQRDKGFFNNNAQIYSLGITYKF